MLRIVPEHFQHIIDQKTLHFHHHSVIIYSNQRTPNGLITENKDERTERWALLYRTPHGGAQENAALVRRTGRPIQLTAYARRQPERAYSWMPFHCSFVRRERRPHQRQALPMRTAEQQPRAQQPRRRCERRAAPRVRSPQKRA